MKDWLDSINCRPIVVLQPSFINSLVPTNHGNYVVVGQYRSKSAQKVYPNRHSCIIPAATPQGARSTKTSVLRELSAVSRSRNICSSATWRKDEKPCRMRSEYLGDTFCYSQKPKLPIPPPPELDTTPKKLLDERSMMDNAWISSEVDSISPKLLESCHVQSGTNTESTSVSLDQWHGADWQCKLPKMYLPRKIHRDSYASVIVRSKSVKSRWRGSGEMPGGGERLKC